MKSRTYSATASRQERGGAPVSDLNFVVERTEYTGRRAIKLFMSASLSGATVFAFSGTPSL